MHKPVFGDGSASFTFDQTSTRSLMHTKKDEFSLRESRAVRGIRLTVLLTLLFSAIGISLGVWYHLQSEDNKAFERSFQSDADKVMMSFAQTLDDNLGAADAFGVKMISSALTSNSTWPEVTVPNFALHATKVLRLSKAFHLYSCVLVDGNRRNEWQEYADRHKDWIQESLDIQEQLEDWTYPIIRDFENSYDVIGIDSPVGEATSAYNNTHLVTWQAAPMITGPANPLPYNRDVWYIEQEQKLYLNALHRRRATMSEFFWHLIRDPNDEVEIYGHQLTADWSNNFIPPDEPAFEPSFAMVLPLVNSVDAVDIDVTDESIPIVGVLGFNYYFREFLRDVLMDDDRVGLIVVVENACGGPAFTYRIDGTEAIYLGPGDQHDAKYEGLKQQITIGALLQNLAEQRGADYSGVPFDDEFCPKTLNIYASQDYEDVFHDDKPLLFTIFAVCIFIFTTMVFFAYDVMVARRQRLVMAQAKVSGAIVSSLFPEVVREKLYAEQRGRKSKIDDLNLTTTPLADGLDSHKNRPIAELYHNTTVSFMDLAGFTKWSSMRTPVEVFELLEAVYGAFDKIAKRRRVFKVETIGDCYVAVTGIPNVQPDHAVRMVKFVSDCMVIFNHIKIDLMNSLGADTADLQIRIGLHSGSTTGGVLRGDKGRFQLFGDTVNTASRMESTGVPGKIQCSQATADELVLQNKREWLTIRESFVSAKGKGEMLVYFVREEAKIEEPRENLDDSETEHDVSTNSSNRLDMTGGITCSTRSESIADPDQWLSTA